MTEQVIWWGFMLATACSVVHACVMVEHGIRSWLKLSPHESAPGFSTDGHRAANTLRAIVEIRQTTGRDSPGLLQEEVLARLLVERGFLTESEFSRKLSEETESFEEILEHRTLH